MKILGILLLCFNFLACSKVGLGYSLGTRQIKNKVQDTFEFSPRSKNKEIDIFLSEQFDQNKKAFFIQLKEQLRKVQVLANKDQILLSDIDTLFKDAQLFQKNVIYIFKPSFVKVIAEIKDSEISFFKKYATEQLKEKLEEASDTKSFKQKKITTTTRVAEFFFDELNDEQTKLIEKFIQDHLAYYNEQIQIRHSFHQELIRLYPIKDKMQDLSIAFYSGDNSARSENYVRQRLIFETDFKNFILSLLKIRNSKQTKFMQNRIQEIIQEIDKIIEN